jgi:hypothetical protein
MKTGGTGERVTTGVPDPEANVVTLLSVVDHLRGRYHPHRLPSRALDLVARGCGVYERPSGGYRRVLGDVRQGDIDIFGRALDVPGIDETRGCNISEETHTKTVGGSREAEEGLRERNVPRRCGRLIAIATREAE